MTDAITRRATLTGAAAVAAAASVPQAAHAKLGTVADPVIGMIERWWAARNAADATIKAMENCPDEIFDAICDPIHEQEEQIFLAPVTTVAGVLAKCRLYFEDLAELPDRDFDLDQAPHADMCFPERAALCILRDLKRLAREGRL